MEFGKWEQTGGVVGAVLFIIFLYLASIGKKGDFNVAGYIISVWVAFIAGAIIASSIKKYFKKDK